MAFTPKTWKAHPDTTTPVTAVELNRIEKGISEAYSTVFYGNDTTVARPPNPDPVTWVGHNGVVPANAREDFDIVRTFAPPVGPATAPPALAWTLAYWANDITTLTDGAAIAQWNDRGASARHATQATAANQPKYVASDPAFNTRQTVSFPETTSNLITPSFAADAQPNTVVTVATIPATVGGIQRILCDGLVSTDRNTLFRTTDAMLGLFAGTAVGLIASYPTTTHLIVAVYNGASSYVLVDGVKTLTPATIGTQATTGFTLGARYNAVDGFQGKAAFFGALPGEITVADADAMLAWSRENYKTP